MRFIKNNTLFSDVFDFDATKYNETHLLLIYSRGSEYRAGQPYLYYRFMEVESGMLSEERIIDPKHKMIYPTSEFFSVWTDSDSEHIFVTYLAVATESEARAHQIAFGEAIAVYVASTLKMDFAPTYHDVIRLFIFIIPEWLLLILVFGTILLLVFFAIYTKKKTLKLSSK